MATCNCGICEKDRQEAKVLAEPAMKPPPQPFTDRVLDLAGRIYVDRPRFLFDEPEYTYSDAISDAIDIIIAGDNQ